MHKLTLNLKTGKHFVYPERFVKMKYESKLHVKNICIFWRFKNILKNANDKITGITFGEEYWTFNMISKKLSESNIQLERNWYDNTCKIHSPRQLNLFNFGPLLGFPVNTVVQANTWTTSPSNVDVKLGLRYVTVSCGCVDINRNFDTVGRKSKVIATIPVTTEQSLNETVTFYDDIRSEVSVLNGDHGVFEFDISTNIGNAVDLNVMFEVYIE